MKHMIVAALVISLVLMAGCVGDEEAATPTASPTATPVVTETPVPTATAEPTGLTSPTMDETLRDRHPATLPAEPTGEDCLGCHGSISYDPTTDNLPHITHVIDLKFDCTTCHKVNEPLPAYKKLVPIETCLGCHPDYAFEASAEGEAPGSGCVEGDCHSDAHNQGSDCTDCHEPHN